METLILIAYISMLIILNLSLITLLTIGVMLTYGSIISKVPIVMVRQRSVSFIIETLKLSDDSILYDLGSGDGRVLEYALKHNPNINVVGLELAPWPRLVSKIRLKKFGRHVQILNKDFFTYDFSNASHIYLYLLPAVMDELKPIFDKTLSHGTRVVSCDFQFTNKSPDEILAIPNSKMIAKTLYVYTW